MARGAQARNVMRWDHWFLSRDATQSAVFPWLCRLSVCNVGGLCSLDAALLQFNWIFFTTTPSLIRPHFIRCRCTRYIVWGLYCFLTGSERYFHNFNSHTLTSKSPTQVWFILVHRLGQSLVRCLDSFFCFGAWCLHIFGR